MQLKMSETKACHANGLQSEQNRETLKAKPRHPSPSDSHIEPRGYDTFRNQFDLECNGLTLPGIGDISSSLLAPSKGSRTQTRALPPLPLMPWMVHIWRFAAKRGHHFGKRCVTMVARHRTRVVLSKTNIFIYFQHCRNIVGANGHCSWRRFPRRRGFFIGCAIF